MAVIVIALKRPHLTSKEGWIKILTIGTFQTAGVNGLHFFKLTYKTASESSILIFTNPLLVVVFTTVFTKVRYQSNQWCGVLLGIIGVMITMGTQVEMKMVFFQLFFGQLRHYGLKNGACYLIHGCYKPIKCFLVVYYFYWRVLC